VSPAKKSDGGAGSPGSSVKASAAGGKGSAANGRSTAKRPRDRERTIEQILDAAEKLVEEKGPDGFGLAELGREAGISFGLIHHYFGGKEGLLKAVLRRTLRGMGREIRRIQEDGSFWRRDAPAVVVVFDTFTNRPGFGRLLGWGLLSGLITAEDFATEVSADAQALDVMIEAFREESPDRTGDSAAIITTLLMSAVIGFNLLRPMLVSAFDWAGEEDELLRGQLARAVVGLAKPDSA
jgi:AcrR family transcriptional regulator